MIRKQISNQFCYFRPLRLTECRDNKRLNCLQLGRGSFAYRHSHQCHQLFQLKK